LPLHSRQRSQFRLHEEKPDQVSFAWRSQLAGRDPQLHMRPCGSGGGLVLEGKYEGPDALLKIKGKQLLTYGRADFPVYCSHEPIMELQDIKANGAPFVVIEPTHELGKQHCNFIIYKDRSKVPAKYYERLGLKKPAPEV
jgi:hypothetical protein